MALKRIQDLSAAGALTGAELIELEQAGASVQCTTQDIADLGGGGSVVSVVAGAGIDVDATDPANPEVALDSATIASLALADSATQPGDLGTMAAIDDAPSNGTGYVRKDGAWAAESGSAATAVRTETASYTAALNDQVVQMNVASANDFTVPPNSSVAFPTGWFLEVWQQGAGQTTVVAGSGVTILYDADLTLNLKGQHSGCSLRKVATDTWRLVGGMEPV